MVESPYIKSDKLSSKIVLQQKEKRKKRTKETGKKMQTD